METPLAVRELQRASFLQRCLGQPLVENAYIEIENLLASRRWTDIDSEEIFRLLRKHGAVRFDRDRAKRLFEKALQTCVTDDVITDEEAVGLTRLQDLLGLRDEDVREIERHVTHPRYRMALADVFRDGVVTDAESEGLASLRKALRINERAAREMWHGDAKPVFEQARAAAANNERLSSGELQLLDSLAKNFRIAISPDLATQEQLARYRAYWLMENGTYPEVAVPLALQRKEACHFSCASTRHEMKSETATKNYDGRTARIRIMKGVYYRFGSFQAQRVRRGDLRQIDSGTLYVTNRRIIFDGMRRKFVISFAKVIAFTPYSDAIGIDTVSRQTSIFTLPDPEWLGVLLSSLLAHSH